MCEIKKLISEVKVRPEIWDSTLKLDRATRKKAWNELCSKCTPNFHKKSVREKKYLVSQLKNKWNGLRDNFKREYWRLLRKQQNNSESSTSRKPFKYYYNLTFLLKLIEQPVTESVATQEEDSIQSPALDSHRTKRRKTFNTATPELEQETISLQSFPSRLSEFEMDEADRNFMFSLLPHFRKVPNEYKLDAQMEILQVLKRYSSQQQQQQFQYVSQPVQFSVIQEPESSHPASCNEQVASVDSSNENSYI